MAITEVCQFELKEEADKIKADHPELSMAECRRRVIEYYADAGIEVKEETAKKKYQRATRILGTNVPTASTHSSDNEIQEKQPHTPRQERPKCSCGNLAELSYTRKDGTRVGL